MRGSWCCEMRWGIGVSENAGVFEGVVEDGFLDCCEDEADVGGIGCLCQAGTC